MIGRFLIAAGLAALLGAAPVFAQSSPQEATTQQGQVLKMNKTLAMKKMSKGLPTRTLGLPPECSSSPLAERYDGPDSRAPARLCTADEIMRPRTRRP
jgi:hypothetical protein